MVDQRDRRKYGPHLNMESPELKTELDYFIHFIPMKYITDIVIPATNIHASKHVTTWVPLSIDELMKVFGLFQAMEVYHLPNRRMYWETMDDGIFKAMNFGNVVSRSRFEEILHYLQVSMSEDRDLQIIEFLDAVNVNLKNAMRPGDTCTLDESMIKSYHRNLKGKIKIIRKPRPIGNEIKNLSDAKTNIVLHMELYEGKDDMKDKRYTKELGATTATCLRLTEAYKGSGRIIMADSWFGSVKSVIALMKEHGLYSIMLVKTAHKEFPRELLSEKELQRGEWISFSRNVDDVAVQAVSFMDLQLKDFIGTCSTILPGPPRKTKYSGDVSRPQIAYDFLNAAASIDIHNHSRTGGMAFEDVWLTQDPILRQFAGIMGFLFTNAYLALKHFKHDRINRANSLAHHTFKSALANQLVKYNENKVRRRLSLEAQKEEENNLVLNTHTTYKLPGPRKCYYCRHAYDRLILNNTTFGCRSCKVPLCKESTKGRTCWNNHVIKGLPSRKYRRK